MSPIYGHLLDKPLLAFAVPYGGPDVSTIGIWNLGEHGRVYRACRKST